MADILFLSLVFPPDSVSTAQIMGDLAAEFQARGHSVTVLTTTPHYNRDAQAEAGQPFKNYWGPLLRRSEYRGTTVYHALMPKKSRNLIARFSAWIGFHAVSTVAGLMVVRRADVILVPSPPLTIGLSAWLLGLLRRTPFIYNVQEVYPDIAIRLGVLKNARLIKLLFGLERFIYDRASKVTVIASGMRDGLVNKGVPAEKVAIVPNFVDVDDLQPLPKDNAFSRQHGLHDRFVVSYAGNMGPAQGLETFVEAAKLLESEPGVQFLMMGDGILRDELQQRVADLGLRNVTFLPHQPYSLVPQIYATSNISLVPQAAETGFDAVPSKVYRIMACARPVVAVTEPTSDLGRLVLDSQCGRVVAPGSAETLAALIRDAYLNQEQWAEMGENGRCHVSENYTRAIVTEKYLSLFQEVMSR